MKKTYIRTFIIILLAVVYLAIRSSGTNSLAAGFDDDYFKLDGAHLQNAVLNSIEGQKWLEKTDANLFSKQMNIKKFGFIAFGKNTSLKVEVSEDTKDETIIISGSGFRPFETVNLSVAATSNDIFKIAAWSADADSAGKFALRWNGYSANLRAIGSTISSEGTESGVAINVNVSAFSNDPPAGELWIEKHANPPRALPFEFTDTGLTPSTFPVVDDSTTSDQHQTFTISTTVRHTYTVTELDSSPYQLADISCTYVSCGCGPAPIFTRTGASIAIQINYPNFVSCTFVNQIVTAASASVGGRVLTANGRGISNVRISLTDGSGNTHTVLSNPFGFYHFDELPAGQTYILQAQSKRYKFTNPTQVLSVNEDLSEVNFTASP